jgi:hypothetical protein
LPNPQPDQGINGLEASATRGSVPRGCRLLINGASLLLEEGETNDDQLLWGHPDGNGGGAGGGGGPGGQSHTGRQRSPSWSGSGSTWGLAGGSLVCELSWMRFRALVDSLDLVCGIYVQVGGRPADEGFGARSTLGSMRGQRRGRDARRGADRPGTPPPPPSPPQERDASTASVQALVQLVNDNPAYLPLGARLASTRTAHIPRYLIPFPTNHGEPLATSRTSTPPTNQPLLID